ncbi:U-scoloptoxin(05)-Sm1a [Aethina tumida]|uniref:U-scoloptoxin(05)-Sm1a n=1 Tax=Aethina tumida TaxID=116153 RepID=UPI0021478E99|nr:U-scoloptoxin(05)-Sm1a [Aethina tumida]
MPRGYRNISPQKTVASSQIFFSDKMPDNLLLTTVFCFLVFSSASAIKCFQCDSAVDPGCAGLRSGETKSMYYKECTGVNDIAKFCRKVHYSISDGDKENVRIYRQCGWLSTRNDSTCKNSGNNSVWETNCACWTDGCNSSNKIRFDFTVLTIVAAFKLIC